MLGGEEHQVAPLVCAMTGWIAREARRLAAFCPGGRLDPPLSLRLDEAALICPIPLHQWTADMGGRGVSIVACFQSRVAGHRPLRRRQGGHDHQQLRAPGCCSAAPATATTCTYWSTLAGERDEPITTTDLHGRVASRTTRRVPVLAPAQLATLRPGRVVVFTSTIPPVVGRAEQAFRRFDVRAHHTPQAWTVRARIWLTHTAVPWLRRTAVPAARCARRALRRHPARRSSRPQHRLVARMGPRGGRRNRRHDPRTGLREPARHRVAPPASTRRRLAGHPLPRPARRRLTASWPTARRWRARRRARVDYQPFPQHAPALTRGGADLAEPPAPHSPLFGDPDA